MGKCKGKQSTTTAKKAQGVHQKAAANRAKKAAKKLAK